MLVEGKDYKSVIDFRRELAYTHGNTEEPLCGMNLQVNMAALANRHAAERACAC